MRAGEKLLHKRVRCPACGHVVAVQARTLGEALRSVQDPHEEKQREAAFWRQQGDREIAGCLLPYKAMTEQERQRRAVKQAFASLLPRYDDLTLFALSLSFVLLWARDVDLEQDLIRGFTQGLMRSPIVLWVIVGLAIAGIGMTLSLINVFLRRQKSNVEKFAMLMFAVVVTTGTGFYTAWILLGQSKGWLMVFPAWNILNADLLLILFCIRVVDTDCITDEHASFAQLVITAICVPVLLAVCCCFDLHWAVTYSIAVAYTMSLHNAIRDAFGRRFAAIGRVEREELMGFDEQKR
jgi:hypothetical protein